MAIEKQQPIEIDKIMKLFTEEEEKFYRERGWISPEEITNKVYEILGLEPVPFCYPTRGYIISDPTELFINLEHRKDDGPASVCGYK